MIWLPFFPGVAALALLSSGMAVWAWSVMAVAVATLAVSMLGRWPAAGTLFCTCLVGLALAQRSDQIWMYAVVGLLMVLYLVLLDARESLHKPSELSGVTPLLTEQIVAVAAGQAVIVLALLIPVGGAPVVVVVSAGAAATLFGWLAQTATRRTGPDESSLPKGRDL